MVHFEVDLLNQSCRCTFDKTKGVLIIRPANDGSALFRIDVSVGKIPKVLSGRYTSLNKAKEAVEEYNRTLKESTIAKAENIRKERTLRKEGQNASVSKSENS